MLKKLAIVLILIWVILFSIKYLFLEKTSTRTPSPVLNPESKKVTPTVVSSRLNIKNQDELIRRIKNLFTETSPDIEVGISVYDLKTDLSYGYNDSLPQHAASVSKILTAIYLLQKVQAGEIKFSDELGTYNIEFNLKQMVNQSNTISWEMIDDLLGIRPQQRFAKSLGLNSVNFQDNLMSPNDAAVLFAKLYKGELLEENYQRMLFSYMQNTETENLIAPAIPDNIPLYHKSGLYEGEVHDVAIIDHPEHPFVLAIFTVNKIYPDYEGRAILIQKATSEIYAFQTQ